MTTVRTIREFEGRGDFDLCDGYDFMEVGRSAGWTPISSWGLDGWDLGSWPYVVVLFRGETERAVYVEGDIEVTTFDSSTDREVSTDELALFYWKREGAGWLDRGDDLKGPFSWARLDAAKTA